MGLAPTLQPSVQTSADTTSTAAASPETSTGALASDFETFLRLLTAQLSNQDPLKPMESTEFVSQLASFSAVEQQTRTNKLLEQMVTGLSHDGGAALADWVGREVGITGAHRFDSATGLHLRLTPEPRADSARLDIYDTFGALVASQPVDPSAGETVWAGLLPDGSTAPVGDYRFEINYSRQGSQVSRQDALVSGLITEVRFGGPQGAELILEDGTRISPDMVSAIY